MFEFTDKAIAVLQERQHLAELQQKYWLPLGGASLPLGSNQFFGQALPSTLWPNLSPEQGRLGAASRDPTYHSVVASIIRRYRDAIGTVGFYLTVNGERVDDAPILRMLRMPQPKMTWWELAGCIADGMIANGNVYLLQVSSTELRVLDWRYMIPPRFGQMRYEWRNPVTGNTERYGMDDIIHLRHERAPDGINGRGPLISVFEEIATDLTAGSYTRTLLSRMGVPGIVATPDDTNTSFQQEQADAMQDAIDDRTTGGNRGSSVILPRRLKFHEFQGALQRADMRMLRWVPEERICSACGTPPAVLDIGTGSEQTRVGATMTIVVKEFWEGTITPFLDKVAAQLTAQLVPYFGMPGVLELWPDYEHAPVLAGMRADRKRSQVEQALAGYQGGLFGLVEAREMCGLDDAPPSDILGRIDQSEPAE